MNKRQTTILLSALTAAGSAFAQSTSVVETFWDEQTSSLEQAVPGKFNINIRQRYESFDLDTPSGTIGDGTKADRDGASMRIRYGYTTPNFAGFTAMVEGETLTRLGGEHDDIHPLDDAGDGTDLNQAWVQYADAEYGKAKVGRQIYALDDHRFIGHVGWRQNIQTFDAATAEFSGVEKLSVKAFYLDAQNSVAGDHNELDAAGLNVSYAFAPEFSLTAFYYDIEGDDTSNADASNGTIGLRSTGVFALEELKLSYAASIAEQEETGPSTLDYDASYYAVDLAAIYGESGITVGGGFEIMESDFRTPLATVHKFNGFADALLPTKGFTNGLEDFYVYAGYTIPVGNGINAKVLYHWFDSEESGASGQNGGTEIDLLASYKVNKYMTLVGKYGDYNTDGGVGGAGGNDKKMFTFEMNFIY